MHKIHIYGAIDQFQGQVSVFNYKSGPTYSDLYPKYLKLSNQNCNTAGILGLLTGVIGLLQAIEAVKVIIGTNQILSGKILIYNALKTSFKISKINTRKIKLQIECNNNSNFFKENIISPFFFNKLIINKEILLIDVRQNIEFNIIHIKKSINIPIKNLNNQNTKFFFENYCQNKTLIIYCSNNSRGIIASKILNKNKIVHYRLKHGIHQLKYNNNFICNDS